MTVLNCVWPIHSHNIAFRDEIHMFLTVIMRFELKKLLWKINLRFRTVKRQLQPLVQGKITSMLCFFFVLLDFRLVFDFLDSN